MRFSLRLAAKEIIRNRYKLIIAFVVTLILFMSAFCLCNIASALPENFYNHYETNYKDKLEIRVNNADKELVENKNRYFIDTEFNMEGLLGNFTLFFSDNSFEYYNDTADGNTVYYKGDFVDVGDIESAHGLMKDYFISGDIWQAESKEEQIWISDIAAQSLEVQVGDILTLRLRNVNQGIENFNLTIGGIYDFYKAVSELDNKRYNYSPSIFYITQTSAEDMYLRLYKSYTLIGTLPSVNKLFDTYNLLQRNYDLSPNVVMDMVATVKNAEVICGIIGAFMLVGGLVVVMNFISMFISSNRKQIGLMRALGARSYKITFGYYLIFALLITIVSVLCWAIMPIYNLLISTYCISVGYYFVIDINWYLVMGLFIIAWIIMSLLMLFEKLRLDKIVPTAVLKEED